ncbi:MAG: hypothetical protein KO202_04890 [Methanobacteriaceae archaeon]|nr:hypothetical protein [Methanobacteriaceae archaeon]
MVFNKLKEKILENSKSYQFYKNFYIANKDSKNKVDEIATLLENKKYTREILYSINFNDTIRESEWLIKKNFSLNKSSSSYSFLYVLFRILDEINPKNILELGLGQSSKITSQYANFFDSNLLIIESDKEWIVNFSKNLLLSNNSKILEVPTEYFEFNSSNNLRYKDFSNEISDKKFDLIIIDGPYGYNQEYPRSNVWNLVNNIDKEFIIIVDDYERVGEQNTVNELFKIFNENNINYKTVEFEGIKKQLVIYSPKYKFVSWY